MGILQTSLDGVKVLIGLGAVATTGVPTTLAEGATVLETAITARNLLGAVAGEAEFSDDLRNRFKATLEAHRGDRTPDDARALVLQMIALGLPAPGDLAAGNLDAEEIAGLMLARIDASAEAIHYRGAAERTLFHRTVTATLAPLLRDTGFHAELAPAISRRVLEQLSAIKGDTEALRAGQDRVLAILARIEATQTARASGITDAALIGLAQRITAEVADAAQAFRELENAVAIAIRVQEEGRAGSNLGAFIDAVLARVAELSATGDHDAATAEIEAALAREEAEHKARQTRLLDAALEQDLLRRDAPAAAARLVRKAELELGAGESLFDALRSILIDWYERGRREGLKLDLEVVIELARRLQDFARGPDQAGTALNDLGVALRTLGEREGDRRRIEESTAVFRAALTETTRDRDPRGWARIQMNLGNALQTLGELEASIALLELAVAANREVLKVWTRDQMPLDWAQAMTNLGAALQSLGTFEGGTRRLKQAVTAYRAALEERTHDRVPLDWPMTQMNLGNALRILGTREPGTSRLEEAGTVFRVALEEITRDHDAHYWAGLQCDFGELYLAWFDKTAEPAHLDRAEEHVRAAREVFAEAGASHYLAMTEQQLARIATVRATLPPA